MSIKFDTQAIRSTASFLRQKSEEYVSVYTKLKSTAENMGSTWDDETNLQYVSKIQGCCNDLKAMAEKLLASAQLLEQQGANYEALIESNNASVKKLHG